MVSPDYFCCWSFEGISYQILPLVKQLGAEKNVEITLFLMVTKNMENISMNKIVLLLTSPDCGVFAGRGGRVPEGLPLRGEG